MPSRNGVETRHTPPGATTRASSRQAVSGSSTCSSVSRQIAVPRGAALRRCANCGAVYSQCYADPEAVYVDGYYSGESGFGVDIRNPRFQAFLGDVNAARAALVQRDLGGATGRVLDVGCGTGDFLA